MPSKQTNTKPKTRRDTTNAAPKPTMPPSTMPPSTVPKPSEKSNGEALKKRPAQPVADSSNKHFMPRSETDISLEEKKEQLKYILLL